GRRAAATGAGSHPRPDARVPGGHRLAALRGSLLRRNRRDARNWRRNREITPVFGETAALRPPRRLGVRPLILASTNFFDPRVYFLSKAVAGQAGWRPRGWTALPGTVAQRPGGLAGTVGPLF